MQIISGKIYPHPVSRLEAQSKEAYDALQGGNYQKAYTLYLLLAKSEPRNDTYRLRLAETCIGLKRQDDALRIYKHLAANLIEQGKIPLAISVSKRILEINPQEVEIQKRLEQLYAESPHEEEGSRNEWERAREEARKKVQQMANAQLLMSEQALELAGPHDKVTVGVLDMVQSPEDSPFRIDPNQGSGLELDDGRNLGHSVSGADGYQNLSFSDRGKVADLSLASTGTAKAYPTIPLFSDLPPVAFEKVINHFQRLSHPPNTVILKQGDPGDSIYIVASGKLRVEREVNRQITVVAELSPGDFFGEFAYFAGSKREASVISETIVELLQLTRQSVAEITSEHPKVERAMLNLYKGRVLQNLLRESTLFSSLTDEDRKMIAKYFQLRSTDAGEVIVREGDPPDAFFVVQKGRARVSQKGKPLAELKAGEFFGEYSMITGSPRSATVVALERCILVTLNQDGFKHLLQGRPKVVEALRQIARERLASGSDNKKV